MPASTELGVTNSAYKEMSPDILFWFSLNSLALSQDFIMQRKLKLRNNFSQESNCADEGKLVLILLSLIYILN
jgi:hypothetical protein